MMAAMHGGRGLRRRLRAGLVFAALLPMLGGCGPATQDSRVTIGGTEVAYSTAGHGSPVVVLQSGLGDGRDAWQPVIDRLESGTTVFAYDRPGYGASAATSAARDPCTIAAELRALLKAAGMAPPYLLVGHSLGGLYQFAYARLYPAEVAALVLLDPTHPDHWTRLQREAPSAAAQLGVYRRSLYSPAMRREFDAQGGCRERLLRDPPLGPPATILTRTRFTAAEQGEFQALLRALEREWLKLFVSARLVPVAESGHYVQTDRPDVVAQTIDAVLAGLQPRSR
jgi:pimeloyl-ACP methyl ester carboxylesterase